MSSETPAAQTSSICPRPIANCLEQQTASEPAVHVLKELVAFSKSQFGYEPGVESSPELGGRALVVRQRDVSVEADLLPF